MDGGTHGGKVRVSAAKQMVRSRDSALGHGGPWSHGGGMDELGQMD